MLDPLIMRIISLGFAVLFMLSAIHKMGDRIEFLQILGAYRVLPAIFLRPAALILPNLEMVVAVGWLAIGFLGFQLRAIPIISAGLLLIYSSVIALNLIRGRTDIDCGCGFSSSKTNKHKNAERISYPLVWRNSILALTALLVIAPSSAREITAIDYVALIAATVVCILIYGAVNQLIANSQGLKPWRYKQEI